MYNINLDLLEESSVFAQFEVATEQGAAAAAAVVVVAAVVEPC